MRHVGWVVGTVMGVVVMACNTGDPGRDVPYIPIDTPRLDAGMPDVPPPVCEGTPEPCSGTSACAPGCYQRACTGSPRSCTSRFDFSTCSADDGCYWNSRDMFCDGFPAACGGHTNRSDCVSNDCRWSDAAPCEGVPRACSTLDAASCARAPGCRAAGLDAGAPDASLDAPLDGAMDTAPDAGALCAPVGECDPFVPSDCSGAAACVASAFDTRCGTLITRPLAEGDACTYDNDCQEGLACVFGIGGDRCRRLCRGGSADCTAGTVCGISLGAADDCLHYCMDACDLYAQDCPTGQACVPFLPFPAGAAVIACFPEGTVPIGSACAYADDCVRGAACLGLVCRELCRDTTECMSGTCRPSTTPGLNFCQ